MDKKQWKKLLHEHKLSWRNLYEASETSNDAYKKRQKEVVKAMGQLHKLLKSHAAEQKKNPKNWGYAGDLGHVAEEMKALVDFLD